MKRIIPLFFVFFSLTLLVNGQAYKSMISINNDSVVTLTDYQIPFYINTEALVTGGNMLVNGDDIRFSDDVCAPVTYYDYYIESGMNTDSTLIWVKVPSLPAGSTTVIAMWYGDPFAAPASNFSATFPDAIISSGNSTVSGTIATSWYELNLGDTITLTQQDLLTINARNIIINGVINGKGKGYAIPGSLSTPGTGPGAGGIASPMSSGSGGAGYGGTGGIGCSDAGDFPGAGGASYGTFNGTDLDFGSSGGSSDNTQGGNGGGAVILNASHITVTGNINVNGNDAVLPGGARGGGGGAGGGVMLNSLNLWLSGSITSIGGHGSDGTIGANDGGGGAGGGRIKFFYENMYGDTSLVVADGGTHGFYGDIPGGNGTTGTIHLDTATYGMISYTIGTTLLTTPVDISIADTTFCNDESPIALGGTPAGGNFAGAGVSANQFDPTLVAPGNHYLYYEMSSTPGCPNIDSVEVMVGGVITIDLGSDLTLCPDNDPILDAGPGFANYIWNTTETTQTITPDGGTLGIGTHVFIVTVDDGIACSGTDTIEVTFIDCSGIEDNNTSYVHIYPNPAAEFVQISLPDEVMKIEIVDLTGKMIMTAHVQSKNPVMSVASFASGIYIVTVTTEKGTQSARFIKN